MKLFRVFDKKTGVEVTEDVNISADGCLYWADYPNIVDRKLFFFEYKGSGNIVLGDGDWKTFIE